MTEENTGLTGLEACGIATWEGQQQGYYNTLHQGLQNQHSMYQYQTSHGNAYFQTNPYAQYGTAPFPMESGMTFIRSQTVVRQRFHSSISNHPSAWKCKYTLQGGYNRSYCSRQLSSTPYCMSCYSHSQMPTYTGLGHLNTLENPDLSIPGYQRPDTVPQRYQPLPLCSDEFMKLIGPSPASISLSSAGVDPSTSIGPSAHIGPSPASIGPSPESIDPSTRIGPSERIVPSPGSIGLSSASIDPSTNISLSSASVGTLPTSIGPSPAIIDLLPASICTSAACIGPSSTSEDQRTLDANSETSKTDQHSNSCQSVSKTIQEFHKSNSLLAELSKNDMTGHNKDLEKNLASTATVKKYSVDCHLIRSRSVQRSVLLQHALKCMSAERNQQDFDNHKHKLRKEELLPMETLHVERKSNTSELKQKPAGVDKVIYQQDSDNSESEWQNTESLPLLTKQNNGSVEMISEFKQKPGVEKLVSQNVRGERKISDKQRTGILDNLKTAMDCENASRFKDESEFCILMHKQSKPVKPKSNLEHRKADFCSIMHKQSAPLQHEVLNEKAHQTYSAMLRQIAKQAKSDEDGTVDGTRNLDPSTMSLKMSNKRVVEKVGQSICKKIKFENKEGVSKSRQDKLFVDPIMKDEALNVKVKKSVNKRSNKSVKMNTVFSLDEINEICCGKSDNLCHVTDSGLKVKKLKKKVEDSSSLYHSNDSSNVNVTEENNTLGNNNRDIDLLSNTFQIPNLCSLPFSLNLKKSTSSKAGKSKSHDAQVKMDNRKRTSVKRKDSDIQIKSSKQKQKKGNSKLQILPDSISDVQMMYPSNGNTEPSDGNTHRVAFERGNSYSNSTAKNGERQKTSVLQKFDKREKSKAVQKNDGTINSSNTEVPTMQQDTVRVYNLPCLGKMYSVTVDKNGHTTCRILDFPAKDTATKSSSENKNETTSSESKNDTSSENKNGTSSENKNGTSSENKNGTSSENKNGTSSENKNGTSSENKNETIKKCKNISKTQQLNSALVDEKQTETEFYGSSYDTSNMSGLEILSHVASKSNKIKVATPIPNHNVEIPIANHNNKIRVERPVATKSDNIRVEMPVLWSKTVDNTDRNIFQAISFDQQGSFENCHLLNKKPVLSITGEMSQKEVNKATKRLDMTGSKTDLSQKLGLQKMKNIHDECVEEISETKYGKRMEKPLFEHNYAKETIHENIREYDQHIRESGGSKKRLRQIPSSGTENFLIQTGTSSQVQERSDNFPVAEKFRHLVTTFKIPNATDILKSESLMSKNGSGKDQRNEILTHLAAFDLQKRTKNLNTKTISKSLPGVLQNKSVPGFLQNKIPNENLPNTLNVAEMKSSRKRLDGLSELKMSSLKKVRVPLTEVSPNLPSKMTSSEVATPLPLLIKISGKYEKNTKSNQPDFAMSRMGVLENSNHSVSKDIYGKMSKSNTGQETAQVFVLSKSRNSDRPLSRISLQENQLGQNLSKAQNVQNVSQHSVNLIPGNELSPFTYRDNPRDVVVYEDLSLFSNAQEPYTVTRKPVRKKSNCSVQTLTNETQQIKDGRFESSENLMPKEATINKDVEFESSEKRSFLACGSQTSNRIIGSLNNKNLCSDSKTKQGFSFPVNPVLALDQRVSSKRKINSDLTSGKSELPLINLKSGSVTLVKPLLRVNDELFLKSKKLESEKQYRPVTESQDVVSSSMNVTVSEVPLKIATTSKEKSHLDSKLSSAASVKPLMPYCSASVLNTSTVNSLTPSEPVIKHMTPIQPVIKTMTPSEPVIKHTSKSLSDTIELSPSMMYTMLLKKYQDALHSNNKILKSVTPTNPVTTDRNLLSMKVNSKVSVMPIKQVTYTHLDSVTNLKPVTQYPVTNVKQVTQYPVTNVKPVTECKIVSTVETSSGSLIFFQKVLQKQNLLPVDVVKPVISVTEDVPCLCCIEYGSSTKYTENFTKGQRVLPQNCLKKDSVKPQILVTKNQDFSLLNIKMPLAHQNQDASVMTNTTANAGKPTTKKEEQNLEVAVHKDIMPIQSSLGNQELSLLVKPKAGKEINVSILTKPSLSENLKSDCLTTQIKPITEKENVMLLSCLRSDSVVPIQKRISDSGNSFTKAHLHASSFPVCKTVDSVKIIPYYPVPKVAMNEKDDLKSSSKLANNRSTTSCKLVSENVQSKQLEPTAELNSSQTGNQMLEHTTERNETEHLENSHVPFAEQLDLENLKLCAHPDLHNNDDVLCSDVGTASEIHKSADVDTANSELVTVTQGCVSPPCTVLSKAARRNRRRKENKRRRQLLQEFNRLDISADGKQINHFDNKLFTETVPVINTSNFECKMTEKLISKTFSGVDSPFLSEADSPVTEVGNHNIRFPANSSESEAVRARNANLLNTSASLDKDTTTNSSQNVDRKKLKQGNEKFVPCTEKEAIQRVVLRHRNDSSTGEDSEDKVIEDKKAETVVNRYKLDDLSANEFDGRATGVTNRNIERRENRNLSESKTDINSKSATSIGKVPIHSSEQRNASREAVNLLQENRNVVHVTEKEAVKRVVIRHKNKSIISPEKLETNSINSGKQNNVSHSTSLDTALSNVDNTVKKVSNYNDVGKRDDYVCTSLTNNHTGDLMKSTTSFGSCGRDQTITSSQIDVNQEMVNLVQDIGRISEKEAIKRVVLRYRDDRVTVQEQIIKGSGSERLRTCSEDSRRQDTTITLKSGDADSEQKLYDVQSREISDMKKKLADQNFDGKSKDKPEISDVEKSLLSDIEENLYGIAGNQKLEDSDLETKIENSDVVEKIVIRSDSSHIDKDLCGISRKEKLEVSDNKNNSENSDNENLYHYICSKRKSEVADDKSGNVDQLCGIEFKGMSEVSDSENKSDNSDNDGKLCGIDGNGNSGMEYDKFENFSIDDMLHINDTFKCLSDIEKLQSPELDKMVENDLDIACCTSDTQKKTLEQVKSENSDKTTAKSNCDFISSPPKMGAEQDDDSLEETSPDCILNEKNLDVSSPIFTKSWHTGESCSKFKVDNLQYHPIALPMGYYSDDEDFDDLEPLDGLESVTIADRMIKKANKSLHEKVSTFCQWVLYPLDEVKKPYYWQQLRNNNEQLKDETIKVVNLHHSANTERRTDTDGCLTSKFISHDAEISGNADNFVEHRSKCTENSTLSDETDDNDDMCIKFEMKDKADITGKDTAIDDGVIVTDTRGVIGIEAGLSDKDDKSVFCVTSKDTGMVIGIEAGLSDKDDESVFCVTSKDTGMVTITVKDKVVKDTHIGEDPDIDNAVTGVNTIIDGAVTSAGSVVNGMASVYNVTSEDKSIDDTVTGTDRSVDNFNTSLNNIDQRVEAATGIDTKVDVFVDKCTCLDEDTLTGIITKVGTSTGSDAGIDDRAVENSGMDATVDVLSDKSKSKDDGIESVNSISNSVDSVTGISSKVDSVTSVSNSVDSVTGISSSFDSVNGVSNSVDSVTGVSSKVDSVTSISSKVDSVTSISKSVDFFTGISNSVDSVTGISSSFDSVNGTSTKIDAINRKHTVIKDLSKKDGIQKEKQQSRRISDRIQNFSSFIRSSDSNKSADNILNSESSALNFACTNYKRTEKEIEESHISREHAIRAVNALREVVLNRLALNENLDFQLSPVQDYFDKDESHVYEGQFGISSAVGKSSARKRYPVDELDVKTTGAKKKRKKGPNTGYKKSKKGMKKKNLNTGVKKKKKGPSRKNADLLSREAQEYLGCSVDEMALQVRSKRLPKHLNNNQISPRKKLVISYRGGNMLPNDCNSDVSGIMGTTDAKETTKTDLSKYKTKKEKDEMKSVVDVPDLIRETSETTDIAQKSRKRKCSIEEKENFSYDTTNSSDIKDAKIKKKRIKDRKNQFQLEEKIKSEIDENIDGCTNKVSCHGNGASNSCSKKRKSGELVSTLGDFEGNQASVNDEQRNIDKDDDKLFVQHPAKKKRGRKCKNEKDNAKEVDNAENYPPFDSKSINIEDSKSSKSFSIKTLKPCHVVLKRTHLSPRKYHEALRMKTKRDHTEKDENRIPNAEMKLQVGLKSTKASRLKRSLHKKTYLMKKLDCHSNESELMKFKSTSSSKKMDLSNSSSHSSVGKVMFKIITDRAEQLKIKTNRHFRCKYCRQHFPKQELQNHCQSLHPWRCVRCVLVFASKVEKILHFREHHSGDEVHHCTICKMTFRHLKQIERHRNSFIHMKLAKLQTDFISLIRNCLSNYSLDVPRIQNRRENQTVNSNASVLPITDSEMPLSECEKIQSCISTLNSSNTYTNSGQLCIRDSSSSRQEHLNINNKTLVVSDNLHSPSYSMLPVEKEFSNGKKVTIKHFFHYEPGMPELIRDLELRLGSQYQPKFQSIVTDLMPEVPFDSIETVVDQISIYGNISSGTIPSYLQSIENPWTFRHCLPPSREPLANSEHAVTYTGYTDNDGVQSLTDSPGTVTEPPLGTFTVPPLYHARPASVESGCYVGGDGNDLSNRFESLSSSVQENGLVFTDPSMSTTTLSDVNMLTGNQYANITDHGNQQTLNQVALSDSRGTLMDLDNGSNLLLLSTINGNDIELQQKNYSGDFVNQSEQQIHNSESENHTTALGDQSSSMITSRDQSSERLEETPTNESEPLLDSSGWFMKAMQDVQDDNFCFDLLEESDVGLKNLDLLEQVYSVNEVSDEISADVTNSNEKSYVNTDDEFSFKTTNSGRKIQNSEKFQVKECKNASNIAVAQENVTNQYRVDILDTKENLTNQCRVDNDNLDMHESVTNQCRVDSDILDTQENVTNQCTANIDISDTQENVKTNQCRLISDISGTQENVMTDNCRVDNDISGTQDNVMTIQCRVEGGILGGQEHATIPCRVEGDITGTQENVTNQCIDNVIVDAQENVTNQCRDDSDIPVTVENVITHQCIDDKLVGCSSDCVGDSVNSPDIDTKLSCNIESVPEQLRQEYQKISQEIENEVLSSEIYLN